ncbi:PaaI family thioesterase [Pseudomonas sp. B392_1p]|uniref:PaaI family thioesterase n=1 Tax=Pseudomonas sp. B392_1p TaxID=3457507 RepID=UPI003FD073D3
MSESAMLSAAQLQRVVDANPYGCWLQLRVHAVTNSGIELRVPGRPEFIGTQALQRLHGGVITSLIDVACGYAVLAATGQAVSTVSLHTDFHRAASLGELHIEGRVLHQGGRICTAEAFIRDDVGTLLASGRCTIHKSREIHPALAPQP